MFGFIFLVVKNAFRATILATFILWFGSSEKSSFDNISLSAASTFEQIAPQLDLINFEVISAEFDKIGLTAKLAASAEEFKAEMEKLARYYHSPKS